MKVDSYEQNEKHWHFSYSTIGIGQELIQVNGHPGNLSLKWSLLNASPAWMSTIRDSVDIYVHIVHGTISWYEANSLVGTDKYHRSQRPALSKIDVTW